MKLININNKLYSKKLIQIQNPPINLYTEGNLQNLNTPAIAIIGSRNCTEYGKKWCKVFVKELVKYNLTIVSGMATGIDAIAHQTALKANGKTIAVLPCGFNHIFPKENLNLYHNILKKNGTVITEYSPEIKANSKRFLERNRIVSGLSIATLVVEAAYRSGTSVTARIATLQSRDVYCIPR